MNEVLLALLVIAANTLITYFLLNRQERRLSQQAFEHQTRFADNYTKRIKILDEFCKKFEEYKMALWHLSIDTKKRITGIKKYKHKEYIAKRDDIVARHRDLTNFYTSNSFFFSKEASLTVLSIFSYLIPIEYTLFTLSHDLPTELVDEKSVSLELMLEILDAIDIKDVDIDNPELLIDRVISKLMDASNDLQKLYDSEVGLKP